jgi:hypothetical protein
MLRVQVILGFNERYTPQEIDIHHSYGAQLWTNCYYGLMWEVNHFESCYV